MILRTGALVLPASAFRGLYLSRPVSRLWPSILRCSRSLSSITARQLKIDPSSESSHPAAPVLRILNSLGRQKTVFTPIDPEKKRITWYTCGPTCYDDAHQGHGRNAVSLDIVRRILQDYFGYSVKFVMNITDVDDKIILKSRYLHLETRLLNELESQDRGKAQADALTIGKEGLRFYISRNLPLLSPDTTSEIYDLEIKKAYSNIVNNEVTEEQDAKLKMHIRNGQQAASALLRLEKATDSALLSDFVDHAKDVLHPYLDHLHGTTIDSKDHDLFSAVARKYEERYFEDMHTLNVLDPDVLTRATEYIPQMIAFVQRIVDKGFAYATDDGSVYFDIAAFEAAGHSYSIFRAVESQQRGAPGRRRGVVGEQVSSQAQRCRLCPLESKSTWRTCLAGSVERKWWKTWVAHRV
ncbi:cysteinyl-tRNA synthetase [Pseudogymnoascus australis]